MRRHGQPLRDTPPERHRNMAQQTTVTLTDDIDGGKAAETVSFGLDGRHLRDRPEQEERDRAAQGIGRIHRFRSSCPRRQAGGQGRRPRRAGSGRCQGGSGMGAGAGHCGVGPRPGAGRDRRAVPGGRRLNPTAGHGIPARAHRLRVSEYIVAIVSRYFVDRKGFVITIHSDSAVAMNSRGSFRHRGRGTVVEEGGRLSDLSSQFRRLRWRRSRRSARDHRQARLSGGAGCRRHLAVAGLSVAAGRQRLRHQRLPGHRADLRDAGRFRRVDRRACTHRGMRLVMDLVVNHTSDEHPWFVESRSVARPIPSATGTGGGPPGTAWPGYPGRRADQLGVVLLRIRLEIRRHDRRVLPAPVLGESSPT